MKKVTHEVGLRPDGIPIVRNFFIYTDTTNYMVKAHSYFSKRERKEAKLSHKMNLVKL